MKKNAKVMIVTGSSRGIGRKIALDFADNGFDIVINYYSNVDAANEGSSPLK